MAAPLTFLGQKLFGKAFKGVGNAVANSIISPGLWAEELGRVMGVGTRNQAQRLVRAAVKGRPAVQAKAAVPPTPPGYNFATGQQIPGTPGSPAVKARRGIKAKPAVYADVDWADQPLTRSGKFLQTAGVLAGGGTLGYQMMKGDGTEPAKDKNGVINPAYNEELAKFRAKFQADYLGNDAIFSPAKYQAIRGSNAWVDTAIDVIGKDTYLELKQQLADGTLEGGAAKMHSILTDAIAELGDMETLKQAGSKPYVLPGLVTKGERKKVIVLAPMKGAKDKEFKMQSLLYGVNEDE